MNDKCVVLNAKKMNFDGKLDFSFYLLMLQYMMILNLSSAMQVQMKMLACGNHDNFTRKYNSY